MFGLTVECFIECIFLKNAKELTEGPYYYNYMCMMPSEV